MSLKNGLIRTIAAAILLALIGCSSATDSTKTSAAPAAAAPQQRTEAPPTEAEMEVAQAAWQSRQAEVNQVLATMDRTTFIGDSPTKGTPRCRSSGGEVF